MTAVGERFARFFSAVNDGQAPYPWQIALAERIAASGRWPAAISAPTGAGKSSVVDVHVFLVAERERQRALVADGEPPATIARPPRRLVLVAPRRVLVDDQFERAQRLAERLSPNGRRTDDDSIVAEVAQALDALRTTKDHDASDSPLGVARLRGGVRLDLTWRLDPAQCQIVCATPQMWGSRLLLRGYRGSRRARNLESGLLCHDVAVVVDEAHLHERLLDTATRVSASDPVAAGLHIVAMSATRQAEAAVTLTDADVANDELRRRVRAEKRLELVEVDDWKRDAVAAMVDEARRLHGRGTVGVFVNTVPMALQVAAALDGEVKVVCGRMRPADIQRLRDERPGLLNARGNPDVDYLVTTQSLEVGVDLDLPAMVSAVAPASALAQRAGRLNRSGTKADAVLAVVAPRELAQANPSDLGHTFAPYDAEEIVAAAGWLAALDGDASPERISATPLPQPPRPPLPALTRTELETAAMTGSKLSADLDVSFYVEEPRDREERVVAIAARRFLDLPDRVVRQALLAAPPRAHELTSIGLDGKALDAVLDASRTVWVIRSDGGRPTADPLADPSTLRAARPTPEAPPERSTLRAGDVIVVPHESPVCTGRVLGLASKRRGDRFEDVMAERPDGTPDAVVRLERDEIADVLAQDETLGSRPARRALAEVLTAKGESELAGRLRTHRRLADLEVTWCGDDERPVGLLVVSPTAREGWLPATSVSETLVTVDDHGDAVHNRMAHILDVLDADDLGVARDQLLTAARWHDEGKRHPRFQRRMGAEPGGPELAKPAPGHKADGGDGWRHEPYGAGAAFLRTGRDPVAAVIGAPHHGHGRPFFDRDAEAMLDGWPDCDPDLADAVRWLFGPSGRYQLERARLQQTLGVHRLAYLEALLRCADMQISREGR